MNKLAGDSLEHIKNLVYASVMVGFADTKDSAAKRHTKRVSYYSAKALVFRDVIARALADKDTILATYFDERQLKSPSESNTKLTK